MDQPQGHRPMRFFLGQTAVVIRVGGAEMSSAWMQGRIERKPVLPCALSVYELTAGEIPESN